MTNAGIDVASDHLDLALRQPDENVKAQRFDNTADGIEALTEHLTEAKPERIVLEASGGYERPLVAALGAAGLPAPW